MLAPAYVLTYLNQARSDAHWTGEGCVGILVPGYQPKYIDNLRTQPALSDCWSREEEMGTG